jgi:hypothetical protein
MEENIYWKNGDEIKGKSLEAFVCSNSFELFNTMIIIYQFYLIFGTLQVKFLVRTLNNTLFRK